MKSDPAIEAIRQARKRISRQHNNDPKALVAHYIEYQKRFEGRLLRDTSGRARHAAVVRDAKP